MASVVTLEIHHPTMSMIWGHGDQSKINKERRHNYTKIVFKIKVYSYTHKSIYSVTVCLILVKY